MLRACAARFDVTGNFENFLVFTVKIHLVNFDQTV